MANKKKKRKKKGNGHRIGGAFENKIRLLLINTFAPFGITPTDAFRSVKSGGHKDSYGDISISPAMAKLFPYAIECKNYSRIDLHQLFVPWKNMGKSNQFKGWWKQTLEGANKSKSINLYPLLVFRSKGQHIMCMTYSHHLYPVAGIKDNFFEKKKVTVLKANHEGGELLCFYFDELLKVFVKKAKKGTTNGIEKISSK